MLERHGSRKITIRNADHDRPDDRAQLSEKLDRLIAAVSSAGPAPVPRDRSRRGRLLRLGRRARLSGAGAAVNRVDIGLIRGVDRVRDILIDNTRRFAAGLPANNALLWGARGMGKSSLVKAVHAAINAADEPSRRSS